MNHGWTQRQESNSRSRKMTESKDRLAPTSSLYIYHPTCNRDTSEYWWTTPRSWPISRCQFSLIYALQERRLQCSYGFGPIWVTICSTNLFSICSCIFRIKYSTALTFQLQFFAHINLPIFVSLCKFRMLQFLRLTEFVKYIQLFPKIYFALFIYEPLKLQDTNLFTSN